MDVRNRKYIREAPSLLHFISLKNSLPHPTSQIHTLFPPLPKNAAVMYDSSSAFTHDDFQSSIVDDHVPTAAFNTVTLFDAVAISNNILASEHVTQHDTANILVTTICGESSSKADVQDLNPHHKSLVDAISYTESGNLIVAPEEVPVHRIDPKISDPQKTAEPDTVTFQGDMIEIKDLGHRINQDPVYAPTLHKFPVKATASCEEAVPRAILMTCKVTQDTGNKPVKAAFEGENLVLDAICSSTPRRKTCRPLRPSRDIHPPQLESRKREAAKKMVETAKRARQSDECMSLILIMPNH